MKRSGKEKLCVECHKYPVFIASRDLCHHCYPKVRADSLKRGIPFLPPKEDREYKNPRTIKKGEHEAEINFISTFFDHNNWVHHPAMFNLGENIRYTPDFYDGKRNMFIEVVGSRQAFNANKEKYKIFIKKFPKLKFEIRDSKGNIYRPISDLHLDFRTFEAQHIEKNGSGLPDNGQNRSGTELF